MGFSAIYSFIFKLIFFIYDFCESVKDFHVLKEKGHGIWIQILMEKKHLQRNPDSQ